MGFIDLLVTSLIELFYLLGIVILIGFLLGYLEKQSDKFLVRSFGRKGILMTAWLGTPLHELSHAIMCILFRHKITEIKWLQWNTGDGVLGYVNHEYSTRSIYQRVGNFFIGIAPVIGGVLALIVSMYYLVPDSYDLFSHYISNELNMNASYSDIAKSIVLSTFMLLKSLFVLKNLINPLFWIFLVIAICVSSHIALSPADMKGAFNGLVMIFALLFVFNLFCEVLNMDTLDIIVALSKYNAYVLAFSSVAVLFSSITIGISILIYQIKKWVRKEIAL